MKDTTKQSTCGRWISVLLALLWVPVTSSGADQGTRPNLRVDGHFVHPTRILAKWSEGTSPASRAAMTASEGLDVIRSYATVPGLVVFDESWTRAAASQPSTGNSEIDLTKRAQILIERIATLRQSGHFDFVEPDFIATALAMPNDEYLATGTLWGLHNNGTKGKTPGMDINAEQAWEITTGSNEVIVAVVDSGILYTHQDLASRMWINPGEIPGNGIDDDGNGYVDDIHGIDSVEKTGDPIDRAGHGTHVAGIIGAAANDGNPMVGVAWNVRLMACRFLEPWGGGSLSDAIECIDYAVSNGARVINCSWGDFPYSEALREAFISAGLQGALFMTGAANGQLDNDLHPNFPSGYDLDNVVSVAAIDPIGRLAKYSNYGRGSVDLAAPGVAIMSTYAGSDQEYLVADGTSMATAFVSGAAALIAARYPFESAENWRDRLLNTTVALPSMVGLSTTGGMLDAHGAVSAVPTGHLSTHVSPVTGSALIAGRSATVSVRVTDLIGVNGAIVTGTTSGGQGLTLLDDGREPDRAANDARYSGNLEVPTSGNHLEIEIQASMPGKSPAIAREQYEIQYPPTNDPFSNRTPITGRSADIEASNTHASLELDEPNHDERIGGASVWWTWTADDDSQVTLTTWGDRIETILAVYTGEKLETLAEVASNSSGDDIFIYYSRIKFDAAAGMTYQIAVDGYEGQTGTIHLSLDSTVPVNDNFADRIVVTGDRVSQVGSNMNATVDAGEPLFDEREPFSSVWWSWTAPRDGTVHALTLGSDFDTVLTVFTGDSVANLVQVAGNDDVSWNNHQSLVTFEATIGQDYLIRVDGSNSDVGTIGLTILTTPPINDGFQQRTQLSGLSYVIETSNVGATREEGEPRHADQDGGGSLWWTWPAQKDGPVTITTIGSVIDTLLGIYTGDSLASLELVASNDDIHGGLMPRSRVVFDATKDTTYQIAVDGRIGEVGDIVLILESAHPANDRFADRTEINGLEATVSGSNVNATSEPGEPYHAGAAGSGSIWWTWTAPSDRIVTLTTESGTIDPLNIETGTIDTLLAVYTGDSIASLEEIASAEDGVPGTWLSRLQFHATEGTPYQIALDGWGEDMGSMDLHLSTEPFTTPPLISKQPESQAVTSGGNATLSLESLGPATSSIQWRRNGTDAVGATSPMLDLADVDSTTIGAYTAVITNPYGTVTSRPAIIDLAPVSRLTNFSVRCRAGKSDETLILGFAVGGSDSTQSLIRGIGPSLGGFGLVNPIQDPVMALYNHVGVRLRQNDNWNGLTALVQASLRGGAFPLSSDSRDAVLLHDVRSGVYTVHLTSVGDPGTALMELYATDQARRSAHLVNASVRTLAGKGEDTLIAGFVIEGSEPMELLIRGIGPGLIPFGIDDVLNDPAIVLFSGSEKVSENDDWGGTQELADAFDSVQAFALPAGSRDSALLIKLQSGVYTVHVGGGIGVALVELYVVP